METALDINIYTTAHRDVYSIVYGVDKQMGEGSRKRGNSKLISPTKASLYVRELVQAHFDEARPWCSFQNPKVPRDTAITQARNKEALIFQISLTPPCDAIIQSNSVMQSPPFPASFFYVPLFVPCDFSPLQSYSLPPPDRCPRHWSAMPHILRWRTPDRSTWSGCARDMLVLLEMLLFQASCDRGRSCSQIRCRMVQNLGSIKPKREIREENAAKHSQQAKELLGMCH